ncbi:MAG: dihydropteroate synthase [Acidobacteria bacterium]|nr:dihydropteroate synthase [Acidobacteriota bacterium]
MQRKRFEWKTRSRSLMLGERTLIMGILNVTPDSFSDGGKYSDPDRAFARALELEDEGADIIDIGAESTRPGSPRINEGEELRRLVPVLKRLEGKLRVPVSVDTYKAAVAEKALEYGAEIINDPSGLTFDPQVARVAANANGGLILNHMRGTPETWNRLGSMKNAIATIRIELDAAIGRARRGGMEPERIVVDPGLGFGKRREQNSEILAHLAAFAELGRPVLVGPSRKQFLAQTEESAREFATAAAVTASIFGGAHIVRVHNVKVMTVVTQVADAIIAAEYVREPEEREAPPPRHGSPSEEPRRRPIRPTPSPAGPTRRSGPSRDPR